MADLAVFFEEGLEDISVSRLKRSVKWGIPVADDPDQMIYVWLDALANYLTVQGYPKQFNEAVHIVGKDILKFHAIYWPAFLMAAGQPLPRQIIAHGHWTRSGGKMSKSVGNVVDPLEIMTSNSADALRYYLLKEGRIDNDRGKNYQ